MNIALMVQPVQVCTYEHINYCRIYCMMATCCMYETRHLSWQSAQRFANNAQKMRPRVQSHVQHVKSIMAPNQASLSLVIVSSISIITMLFGSLAIDNIPVAQIILCPPRLQYCKLWKMWEGQRWYCKVYHLQSWLCYKGWEKMWP